MAQYIDKDALVAEIERREKIYFNNYHIKGYNSPADYGASYALTQILAFIDTLKVKQVDFGMELCKYMGEHFNVYDDGNQTLQTKDKKSLIGRVDVENIATHFFELGLKAQKGK